MLFDGNHDLVSLGKGDDLSGELISVSLEPCGHGTSGIGLKNSLDLVALSALLLDRNNIALRRYDGTSTFLPFTL